VPVRDHLTERLERAGFWLCNIGAVLGALGVLGWLWDVRFLYTLFPGQPPMMPNTAFSLVLAGAAGALRVHRTRSLVATLLAGLAALFVLGISLGTLAEYAFQVDVGIDQLLIPSPFGLYPGRPSPLTVMALAPIGLAILLYERRRTAANRPSEWLLISSALVALVGLTGQVIGAGALYRPSPAPVLGVAVPTAVGLLIIAGGMLLGRPAAGVMAIATSSSPGGVVLRRIAAPSVLVPMVLGFSIVRLFAVLEVNEFPFVVATVAVAITAAGVAVLVVTARLLNRSHEELRASEERAREVIELASDAIFTANLDGQYTAVNEAGCRLLGMTASEIVGKTIRDMLHPDEVARLATSRAALIAGGRQIGEWRLRHKDGRYIPVEVSARILPRDRWQGIVRDITARKAVEEEARRGRARIEGIISIAGEAIISIDAEQQIILFNAAAEKIFGWTAGEAIGQPLDILIPARFREVHRSHVRRFAEEPVSSRVVGARPANIRGLRKDGTEFIAEAAVSKIELEGEQTFTVVLRDVTRERRRLEQEHLLAAIGLLLTSSRERRKVVKEAARQIVQENFADACVIDLADDPNAPLSVTRSAVVHRDPAKTRTALALERIELDRRKPHIASAALQTRRTHIVARVTPEYIDSIAQSAEHRRLLRDLDPTSLISAPLQARGLVLGALTFASTNPGHLFDQTDAAFVEETARRLALAVDNARLFEIASAAIAARDEVLRIVAHDLRNPLGTILMRASLLRDAPGPNGDRRKTAAAIETAANRMKRLIRDLLDVTRAEARQFSVEHTPIRPDTIIAQAVASQQALATAAAIDLRAAVRDDLPEVLGDRDRLLQVFENLIGNAIKFTPPGGRISVGAAARNRYVVFCVKDTGHGIPAEDLPHVFDRFWQGRRQRRAGAGLGLVIVKTLVEAHGGRVGVHSAPERGTTFYFTIPVAAARTRAEDLPAV
jgi:PAS domain S-box-containing protein